MQPPPRATAPRFLNLHPRLRPAPPSCVRPGHTLRLLNFPTLLEKGLTKVMALRGSMGGMMSTAARLMGSAGVNVPGADARARALLL